MPAAWWVFIMGPLQDIIFRVCVVGGTIVLMSEQIPGGIISPQSQTDTTPTEVVVPLSPSPSPIASAAQNNDSVKQTVAEPVPQESEPVLPRKADEVTPEPIVQPETNPVDQTRFVHEIEEDYSGQTTSPSQQPVSWTASEYIAHQKSLGWYLILGGGSALLTAFIFLATGGDIISSIAVLVLSITFGIYAGRKPREQEYTLDENGVHIGARTYGFNILKSFSILDEGPFSSIVFMPLKRFMPLISIYYDPKDEEKIVNYLSEYLALEYRSHDPIERLMQKIRF